ncbi:MAG: tetratricopeptide repeat protein [Gemmatimonas sp.]
MTTDRTAAFRAMLDKNPDNHQVRFGLANELLKALRFEEAADELRIYLQHSDDEGNGWLRYAEALRVSGRENDARDAITKGVAAATKYNHATLVNELNALRDEMDEG